MFISYQRPIPIGAPSSEFTGWLRRYSWSSRISTVYDLPSQFTMSAAGPKRVSGECSPGSRMTPSTFPKST